MTQRKMRSEIATLTAARDAIPYSFDTAKERHDLFELIDMLYLKLETAVRTGKKRL